MKCLDSTGTSVFTILPGREQLPLAMGEYFVSFNGSEAAFAVSILGGVDVAGGIPRVQPAGLCIVRVGVNQEVGLCNIIKSTIAHPMIRYLLVCGNSQDEISAGRTLLALKENGVDRLMSVIGLSGEPVILNDISIDEIAAFREHVDVVDLTEVNDTETIIAKIGQLSHSCLQRECDCCIVREKPAAAAADCFRAFPYSSVASLTSCTRG
jgi:tetrahydromethanopterin S-methyltransferase subunit A